MISARCGIEMMVNNAMKGKILERTVNIFN